MIAELFYPKELKEIIADLRAKVDLNEGALANLNMNVYVCIFFNLLFIGISFYLFDWNLAALIATASVLINILFIYWVVKRVFFQKMAAYVYGQKVMATVIKSCATGVGPRSSGSMLVYSEELKKEVVVGPLAKTDLRIKYPKKGDTVLVYYSNLEKFNSVIGIKYFEENYCLSNSILQGA